MTGYTPHGIDPALSHYCTSYAVILVGPLYYLLDRFLTRNLRVLVPEGCGVRVRTLGIMVYKWGILWPINYTPYCI